MAGELALRVARAALMEVGLPITGVFLAVAEPGRIQHTATDLAQRAVLLGYMAEYGPDFMVRCAPCSYHWRDRAPCTPVRDSLRGMTCTPTSVPTRSLAFA